MKTKKEIVDNWLPRYTGVPLENFGQYILLTNFAGYIKMFADIYKVPVCGIDRPMQSATAENITIINFGMGSALAATCMDLLSAISPKAVLFLGKCGGLKKKNQLGDFVLPIAAIRGEGTIAFQKKKPAFTNLIRLIYYFNLEFISISANSLARLTHSVIN